MAVFRPSGFDATNPAKSCVLNSLKLSTKQIPYLMKMKRRKSKMKTIVMRSKTSRLDQ